MFKERKLTSEDAKDIKKGSNLSNSRSIKNNEGIYFRNKTTKLLSQKKTLQEQIFYSAQKQLKKGKFIVIDFSLQNSFRFTFLPKIKPSQQTSKLHIQNNKRHSFLTNIQILEKSQYLKDLLAEQVPSYRKNKKVKKIYKTMTEPSLIDKSSPGDHVQNFTELKRYRFPSIEQNSLQKPYEKPSETSPFACENSKMTKQLSYSSIHTKIKPLPKSNKKKKKKIRKISEIQQQILSKSNLTDLKPALINKFQQIRNVLAGE